MLIEYHRTGGFAGLDDHLIISASGEVTLDRWTKHYEFAIDGGKMDQLLVALDVADMPRLRREYVPPSRWK